MMFIHEFFCQITRVYLFYIVIFTCFVGNSLNFIIEVSILTNRIPQVTSVAKRIEAKRTRHYDIHS